MQKRSAEEVEQMLRGYEESGVSREEYCARLGIRVSTFDYYRQRETRKNAAKRRAAAKLVRVTVEPAATQVASIFTLVLANGRRIESSWNFSETELGRLIRIVEGA